MEQTTDPYAPLAPLDHPVAGIFATIAMFVLGWSGCTGLVFQASAPWDHALLALPFPGLLQLLWVGPMLAYAARRGWWRFARAMVGAAMALVIVNAVALVMLYLWGPSGTLF